MQIKRLSREISVSSQIAVTDIPAIAELGFRSIICNRPDGEAGDQPLFEEIRVAGENAALQCIYLPVTSGKVDDADVKDFVESLTELPGPLLAYCRTGTRSVTLWSLANATHLGLCGILTTASNAGYDMSALSRRIAGGLQVSSDSAAACYDVAPAP